MTETYQTTITPMITTQTTEGPTINHSGNDVAMELSDTPVVIVEELQTEASSEGSAFDISPEVSFAKSSCDCESQGFHMIF